MNSKYLTTLPAVAAALLLAACSTDDMDNLFADGAVPAQVTADISNGQTVTRINSSDDAASFTTDDIIRVVANGSETHEYAKQDDGSWSAGNSPYYFQDRKTVSFRGWYADPTETVETDNSISLDTSGQSINDSNWNPLDILATPELSTSSSYPTLDFTGSNAFGHIMSQLTLTFNKGDGISDLSALTGYTLKNLITDASFDTMSCELTEGSTVSDLSQSISGASGTEYSCSPIILVPQNVSGKIVLEVTYNEVTYAADLNLPDSASSLAENTHYTFSVTISNTGLTVNSAEIKEWTAPTTQDADASIKIP